MFNVDRRKFLQINTLAMLGLLSGSLGGGETARAKTSQSFFSLDQRKGRWWLITPEGKPFFSIGLNHVDPTTLRYTESGDIWEKKYQNSMEKWLQAVHQDLADWGFNSLGWNQEVVTINDQNHQHSRSFTFEEYQWLDMPYCHMLPFIESHQWEIETKLPDIYSKGFEEWCDYVARDHCARMKDDPKLIGYFYTDCPTWVHNNNGTAWKAPLFDPEKLNTEAGKKELFNLATKYYQVIHDAIRRYDKNHLLLGDRYEANAPLPEEVVSAAMPYVDVFSFQCFQGEERVKEKLGQWGSYTQKPVLLADSAAYLEPYINKWPPPEPRYEDPAGYREIMRVLMDIPQCVGFHLCGAYLQNKVRKKGLKDFQDQQSDTTMQLAKANWEVEQWVATTFD